MATVDDVVREDITTLRSQITDALTLGDNMVRQSGGKQIASYVQEQLDDLESKKKKIYDDILEKERLVHASNRDFSDTNPIKETKTVLRVIEDHTVAILLLSYLFMLVMAMYWYVIRSPFIVKGLLEAVVGAFFVSLFAFMVLYYVC